MITENEEQELYLKVKQKFLNEKGVMFFIEVDEEVFIKPKIHYFTKNMEVYKKVDDLQRREASYAFFDYSVTEPTYYYHGKNFHQGESLATGKITNFYRPGKKVPIDIQQVKRELKLLGELLGESKIS